MKKTGIILGGIAVLLAIIIAALPTRSEPQQDRQESSSLNILPYSTANRNSSQENILNSAAPTAANRQTVYIVKEYQNVIGVFFAEEEIPFRVIDVPVMKADTKRRHRKSGGASFHARAFTSCSARSSQSYS